MILGDTPCPDIPAHVLRRDADVRMLSTSRHPLKPLKGELPSPGTFPSRKAFVCKGGLLTFRVIRWGLPRGGMLGRIASISLKDWEFLQAECPQLRDRPVYAVSTWVSSSLFSWTSGRPRGTDVSTNLMLPAVPCQAVYIHLDSLFLQQLIHGRVDVSLGGTRWLRACLTTGLNWWNKKKSGKWTFGLPDLPRDIWLDLVREWHKTPQVVGTAVFIIAGVQQNVSPSIMQEEKAVIQDVTSYCPLAVIILKGGTDNMQADNAEWNKPLLWTFSQCILIFKYQDT